jgi:hypothetical protein
MDGRVAHLRLTGEGERRLRDCLTTLDVERRQLRDAIESLTSERDRI